MKKRLLRPASVAIVGLITGLTIAGTVALHHNVSNEEHRLLNERGAQVSALLQSTFQQEITSARVLAQVALAGDPATIQRTFAAGATLIREQGVTGLGIAKPIRNGFLVLAAAGGSDRPGQTITGRDAAALRDGLHSVIGSTTLVNQGAQTRVSLAASVGPAVLFLYESVNPHQPVPAPFSPFGSLKGALYASATPSPSTLVMTTERKLPISGPTGTSTFPVGDDRWTLAFGETAPLVDGWTADLPWFVLGSGLGLALLVAVILQILARRETYASRLVVERTRSLTEVNAELLQARAFIGHLVSSGPIVGMVAAADGLQLLYVTPNLTRLFHFEETEALASGWLLDKTYPEHRDAFVAAVARAAVSQDEGHSERLELLFRVGDGTCRWLDLVIVRATAAIRAAQPSVLIYALDVNDRHRAEESAERANQSKSEFLSRMSHELRTPLNSILGYAQILQMDPLRDDQQHPVEQILIGGRHLLQLINEVLDIARIETGRLSLSLEPVEVEEVVTAAVEMVRPDSLARGLTVNVTDGPPKLAVRADRQRLRQILLNFLSNALKYNRPNGTVTVSYEVRADLVRISVTDTGPGIHAEDFDRVFAAFERLGAEQIGVEGTGMGLAVCRQLAAAMKGEVGLSSEPGRGSTFWVELPVSTELGAPIDLDHQRTTTVSHDDPRQRKVLLVEDNPSNIGLIERILARVVAVELLTATNGQAALELARTEQPDLILLDVHLPDMTGEQVLQTLRAEPITNEIPVIVVSADVTDAQIKRLTDAGANAYVTKPIDVSRLIDLVSRTADFAAP